MENEKTKNTCNLSISIMPALLESFSTPPSVHPPIHPYNYQSINLCVFPCKHPSCHSHNYPSIHLSNCMSVRPSTHSPINSATQACIYPAMLSPSYPLTHIHLPVRPSIHPSINTSVSSTLCYSIRRPTHISTHGPIC